MNIVLSYSLFFNSGRKTNNLYRNGLINNAKKYKNVFQDSTMVVYHDKTVDTKTLNELESHGVILKQRPKNTNWSGTFWRFEELDLINGDDTIVLITDADTDLEVESLLFKKMFNHIGDKKGFVHHGGPTSVRKIRDEQRWMIACAAMVRGKLNTPISDKINEYISRDKNFGNDERFLRDHVWPQIKDEVLISIERRSISDLKNIMKLHPEIFPKWMFTEEFNSRVFTNWTAK